MTFTTQYVTSISDRPDLTQGGDAIWGNATGAPDDRSGSNSTHGNFFSFRARSPSIHGEDIGTPMLSPIILTLRRSTDLYLHPSDVTVDALGRPVPHVETNPGLDKLAASEASRYILQHVPETWKKMMQTNYSYGIERDPAQLEANDLDHTKWTNPLEIRCAARSAAWSLQPLLISFVTTDCPMLRA